jgi:hypothetical protein
MYQESASMSMCAWMGDLWTAFQLCLTLLLGYTLSCAWKRYRAGAFSQSCKMQESKKVSMADNADMQEEEKQELTETEDASTPIAKKRRHSNARQRKQLRKSSRTVPEEASCDQWGEQTSMGTYEDVQPAPAEKRHASEVPEEASCDQFAEQTSVGVDEDVQAAPAQTEAVCLLSQGSDALRCLDEKLDGNAKLHDGQSTSTSTHSVNSDGVDTSESDFPLDSSGVMCDSVQAINAAVTEEVTCPLAGVTRNLDDDFCRAEVEEQQGVPMDELEEPSPMRMGEPSPMESLEDCLEQVDDTLVNLDAEIPVDSEPCEPDVVRPLSPLSQDDRIAAIDWDLIESDDEEELVHPCSPQENSAPVLWCGVPQGACADGYMAVAIPIECAPPGALDGFWKNASGEDISIERLKIAFKSGVTWDMKMHSPTKISVFLGDQEFEAELDSQGEHLHWSDGDVWTFAGQNQVAAPQDLQPQPQVYHDTAQPQNFELQHAQMEQPLQQQQWDYPTWEEQPIQMAPQLEAHWNCHNSMASPLMDNSVMGDATMLVTDCLPLAQVDCCPVFVEQSMMVPQNQVVPQDAEKWEICWDWKKKGWCPRGCECEWYHPSAESPCQPCESTIFF